jgi:hypothetical protein
MTPEHRARIAAAQTAHHAKRRAGLIADALLTGGWPDFPPPAPGLCETCRRAPAAGGLRDPVTGAEYCSRGCMTFDWALSRHAEALHDGTIAESTATRTVLRAVALLYDAARDATTGHIAERDAWAEDHAAGLLDTDYDGAQTLAGYLIGADTGRA